MTNFFKPILIAVLLSTATVSHSQTQEELDQLKQQTDYYKALADLEKARNDALAAKLTPLTGLTGKGEVKLGQGAGTSEAWYLSRAAIDQAGASIASKLTRHTPVVILAGDEKVDLTIGTLLKLEVEGLKQEYATALSLLPSGSCPTTAGTRTLSGAIGLLGALGSLMKTDLDIQSIEVKADHRMLAYAVAKSLGEGHALFPTALRMPDPANSELVKSLNELQTIRLEAARARACFGGDTKQAAAIAAIDAAATRTKAFTDRITTVAVSGTSPLGDGLMAEAIANRSNTFLRVHIERGGGTLITKKNLLTAFGAPPVSVSGGLVASYVATDPATGLIIAAGTIGCATDMVALKVARRPSATPTGKLCSE